MLCLKLSCYHLVDKIYFFVGTYFSVDIRNNLAQGAGHIRQMQKIHDSSTTIWKMTMIRG